MSNIGSAAVVFPAKAGIQGTSFSTVTVAAETRLRPQRYCCLDLPSGLGNEADYRGALSWTCSKSAHLEPFWILAFAGKTALPQSAFSPGNSWMTHVSQVKNTELSRWILVNRVRKRPLVFHAFLQI